MAKQPCLDHVVLLLPYAQLQDLPAWVTNNFTVSEGGKHADGKTENKLILFRDGSYLELIAFVNDDPEKRKGHWWDKPCGVVDFALTGLDYEALASRLQKTDTDISYDPPKAGGRTKPDGSELKWEVTFPTGVDRGNVPFWCEDVTPRKRRVPVTEASTTHASGVLGMAGLVVEVNEDRVARLEKATAAIVDVAKKGGVSSGYGLGAVNGVEELNKPSIRLQKANAGAKKDLALTLVLQTPDHRRRDAINEHVGDEGLVSITFE